MSPLEEALYGILGTASAGDAILEEAISAHINVLAHPRPAGGLTTNALVHFAGARPKGCWSARPGLDDHAASGHVDYHLVLVMPVGTFRSHHGEVKEMLAWALGTPRPPVPLAHYRGLRGRLDTDF